MDGTGGEVNHRAILSFLLACLSSAVRVSMVSDYKIANLSAVSNNFKTQSPSQQNMRLSKCIITCFKNKLQ